MFLKSNNLFLLLFLFTTVISCEQKESTKETVNEINHKHPYAKKIPFSNEFHGITLNDEYFWMQDSSNTEVIDYLKEENRYVDSIMQASQGLQETLQQEFVSRFHPEKILISKINNVEYYYKRNIDDYYPVYYRNSGTHSDKEEVLIDFNKVLPQQENLSISYFEVSPDQQHFAYGLKKVNEADYTLIINNINNKTLTDTIPQVSNFALWAEDSQTIFYTTHDENGRNDKVFNHKIYLPYEEDKLEFYEEDPDFYVSLQKPNNKSYVLIKTESSTSSETQYLDAKDINQNFKTFSSRREGLKYEVFPHINSFFIITNDENNKVKKLMKAVEGATDAKNWQPADFSDSSLTLEYIDVFKDFLVVYRTQEGIPYLEIKDFKKNTSESVTFEEQTAFVKPLPSSFNDIDFRFQYESLLTPKSTFIVDLKTKNKNQVFDTRFADFNKDLYKEERVFVISDDGSEIPLSIVYPKNIKKDGTAPLYLYVEGLTEDESFLPNTSSVNFANRISLLNRGFIFAVAHVRGGRQLHSYWENKTKDINKKQAIKDLIVCTKYLLNNNYTNSDILINMAEGTGAIVAASAINAEPELYSIFISKNPKTDLLQIPNFSAYHQHKFIEQFGDPSIEDNFNLMLTFSPYENIEVKAYPDIFIYSDFYNEQIPYYEALKWAARMREYNKGKTSLLLKTNFKKNKTQADYLIEAALEYAFVLQKLKSKEPIKVMAEAQ